MIILVTFTNGLSKQRDSYQSSPTFLCFENATALFASQHNLFPTMWPDPAKGLLIDWFQTSSSLMPIILNITALYLHFFSPTIFYLILLAMLKGDIWLTSIQFSTYNLYLIKYLHCFYLLISKKLIFTCIWMLHLT